MPILEHQNYRSFLKETFAFKNEQNPNFSLRALAQRLDLAPSFLSDMMKGKKNPSFEKAFAIAKRLELNELETEYFCLLVQIESTEDHVLKESLLRRAQLLNPSRNFSDLSLDHFRIISDWYHFAILAASDLTNISKTPDAFASVLGLSKIEAELALERLTRLEMMERNSKGQYKKTNSNPRVASATANEALRKYHRQTLNKAIESLENQGPQEKVIGSETIAIDSAQLEEFRSLCDQFFEQALALSRKSKSKNRVYHLGVQFFNYTNNAKKENKS